MIFTSFRSGGEAVGYPRGPLAQTSRRRVACDETVTKHDDGFRGQATGNPFADVNLDPGAAVVTPTPSMSTFPPAGPDAVTVESIGDATEIAVGRHDATETVRLIGVVDLAVSPAVGRILTESVDRSRHVVADLSSVRLLDGASVNMFMRVKAHAVASDVGFRVARAQARVLEVLRVTGAAPILCHGRPQPPRRGQSPATGAGWQQVVPVDAVADLLAATRDLAAEDPRRQRANRQVVELCMPVAVHLARRYANSSQDSEDLRQVAALALVKAVHRFDPGIGPDFLGYAVPTVLGELRRYFRDHTWAVRVPRRLSAMRREVIESRERLTHQLGRQPATAEIAAHLSIPVSDVRQSDLASANYRALSLDRQLGHTDTTLGDTVAAPDESIDRLENLHAVRTVVAKLPDRERRILELRFDKQWTQSEIAEEIGVSQMHVSRLLSRTLTRLRHDLLDEGRPRQRGRG
jgi:RNA polymerase sigma-B factor